MQEVAPVIPSSQNLPKADIHSYWRPGKVNLNKLREEAIYSANHAPLHMHGSTLIHMHDKPLPCSGREHEFYEGVKQDETECTTPHGE